jgi:uncharacterized protein DUF3349
MRNQRLRVCLTSVVGWLRACYPEEAPHTGYSPLLALNGPRALTPREVETVVGELDGGPPNATDIELAITKVTDRLPNHAQVRAVTRVLPERAGQPLAND